MVKGYSYDALPMDWVGDWAGRRCTLTPQRSAVVDADSGQSYTFATLDDRANRVGAYLRDALGLVKGDRIAFIGGNRIEPIDLYLAAGKLGVVLAPLSFRLRQPELSELLQCIQPKVLFYEETFAELCDSLIRPACLVDTIRYAAEHSPYQREVLSTPPRQVNNALALDDPYLLIHTGGTTATPKVCIVSHRQMVWNSFELILAAAEGLASRRELLLFPLFHIGGWNTFTPVFHAGGRVVLIRRFEPARVLALIEEQRISHLGAVEAMLKLMAEQPGFAAADLSALRGVTSAGAPCSEAAMRPFWERGIPVSQAYGLTEAGPSNFMHGQSPTSMAAVRARHASVGTAFFHCDYRIVEPQSHQPVRRGEVGVLLLRSPHNFDGYLGQPERTERALLEGGWVDSGDLAREDDAGYVYIVGRVDNQFSSGGENVSPEEIERVLTEHPDIAEAAIFGVADARWGQAPMAVVVASGAPPEVDVLRAYLHERLAGYKVPKHIVYVERLPLTGAGKVDRNAARQLYAPGMSKSGGGES
ncbi:AMP-binding protein [Nitrococcus mobilis]|uniref:Long-chain fatty-acid-CoA ligase n=1 Tax=Nitrococcus mobilis Nb-231 TaxID=314278 RepID=A4BQW5_9GAMM|nr:AMP-binding protein [Nitrococcus mobilis]EAR21965.1 long-chain fatty-acid-CoA ligase [Nitrococcus mobilis Nb-231]